MLWVQAYQMQLDLDRAGYRAADAGFWVALELVIRWTRIRFNLIGLLVFASLFLLHGPRISNFADTVILSRVASIYRSV